jgi:hypothetical protein
MMTNTEGNHKMHRYARLSCAIVVALWGMTAAAQCPLVTGTNNIYDCSTTNIGIGNSNPTYRFQVAGGRSVLEAGGEPYALGLRFSGANGAQFWLGASNAVRPDLLLSNVDGTEVARFKENGLVGLGTQNPSERLEVNGAAYINSDNAGLIVDSAGYKRIGIMKESGFNPEIRYLSSTPLNIRRMTGTTLFGAAQTDILTMTFSTLGNVGIHNSDPQYALDVTGTIHATQVIGATYQDVAEWVPAGESLTPGTVVVLNRERDNEVIASRSAYDTAVAGVVSKQPGLLLGEASPSKAQIATTGRVKVKVDASHGPIHVGDLLVTSDVSGTAMKSQPIEVAGRRFHQPGTIIGKALQPLQSGTGEILVLLSLQ